jgi:hypothetical protein
VDMVQRSDSFFSVSFISVSSSSFPSPQLRYEFFWWLEPWTRSENWTLVQFSHYPPTCSEQTFYISGRWTSHIQLLNCILECAY